MKTKALFFAMFFLALSTSTFAQNARTPVVRERQENQLGRIRHGHRNGELTRLETARLAKQQAHIQRDKRIAKADGRISSRERLHLAHEQNQASRRIARQKHDRQDRN